MEGHQLDSESDIRNKQKKKHIRKRTCNRILTDTITNELKRLSDLNDCSGSTQYKQDHFSMKTFRDVCINNLKNCLAVHQNVIPREIFLYVPKAGYPNEYMCDAIFNNHKEIFHVNPISLGHHENNRVVFVPQHRSLHNGMVRYKGDEWCCCSGIDITRLFIFAKIIYEVSQKMPKSSKKYIGPDLQECNIFTISIQLANLRKLLNPLPRYDGIIRLNQSPSSLPVCRYETKYKPFTKLETSINKSVKFKISVEKHCMRFNITTCKIKIFSKDFLRALESFFSMSKTTSSYEANCYVPSLSVKHRHFHNIIQGYLLSILLRNTNVNTLNMMRKLYFVIIACSASNLIIEITIKLESGIFMVYDNRFYREVISWNANHQLFINKSVSMATLENIIRKRDILKHIKERQINGITHTKTRSQNSNPSIYRTKDFICKAENEEESCINDYYSDTESLQTSASEISAITLPQRNGATLILQPIENAGKSNRTQSNANANSIINKIFLNNSNIYNTNYLHSKQWLIKIFSNNNSSTSEENPKLRKIIDILSFNTLTDSILDKITIQCHLESVTYFIMKHITSKSYQMIFLKSFGKTLSNIFFNTVI